MMKKFIKELLVTTVFVIGTGFYLYKLYTPSDLAFKMNNIKKQLEIVNLGTSHGFDFDYDECGYNGANINKEGNTLYYDLQNLIFLDEKNYLSDGAIIVIPVSYFVFGLGENREDRLPDNSFVNDYYFYLPEEQIYNYSYTKKKSLDIYLIQRNFKNLYKKRKSQDKNVIRSEEQLKKHALSRAIGHKETSNFRPHNKNIKYLDEIIGKSKSKGYRPILVCTPYYHSYNEYMSDEWLRKNYFDVMDSLSKKNNIRFLDYSHDERFTYDNTLFDDSDHLNEKGRVLFSRIICDKIYH